MNKIYVDSDGYKIKVLISEANRNEKQPLIFWIHGGGYVTGMAAMVHMSCGKLLQKRFGGVLASPEYRLAFKVPYPAALKDCYAALEYLWDHSDDYGIDRDRIIVGGESAGGGLAAALCLYARDLGKIRIAFQIPLYPMIDYRDTESSKDNHGKVWNTKRNHFGWRKYLGEMDEKEIPYYASPALAEDYHHLPDCYTFVCKGEPFYSETMKYVEDLKRAGVHAKLDLYEGDVHAFDMLLPWTKQAKQARERLCEVYGAYFYEENNEMLK